MPKKTSNSQSLGYSKRASYVPQLKNSYKEGSCLGDETTYFNTFEVNDFLKYFISVGSFSFFLYYQLKNELKKASRLSFNPFKNSVFIALQSQSWYTYVSLSPKELKSLTKTNLEYLNLPCSL